MAGSTPIYGFPYPQSTDLVADYPTLGQELATDVETVISGLGAGLNMISAASIANSGGTATRTNGQVVFSGVTSVSLNGCFTSTYSAYRIVLDATHSTETNLLLRLRAAGTDASSAYYSKLIYSRYDGTGVFGDAVRNNSDNMWIGTGATGRAIVIDVNNPQLASATGFEMINADNNAASSGGGRHTTATAYDGFTLYVAAGTTTGTVRVYGYKNS